MRKFSLGILPLSIKAIQRSLNIATTLGVIATILFAPLLMAFGMEVETPKLDPSDIYQPNLPTFK